MDADLVALIPDLRRIARRLTRDAAQADDLVQEALARVLARLAGGAEVDDLRAYLMETARNLARSPGRVLAPLEEAAEPRVACHAPYRLALRDVAQGLSRLPPAEVRLILAAARGQSYGELAEDEGVPVGTVMSRLARGRARLRQACGLQAGAPGSSLAA